MQVLTGCIYLLLMLSHTRFVPSIDLSFREETVASASTPQPGSAQLQLPVESNRSFCFGTVRNEEKARLREILQTEARRSIYQQKIKKRNRAVAGEKLYILLGQLKTEG